jgi:hypothetical protein
MSNPKPTHSRRTSDPKLKVQKRAPRCRNGAAQWGLGVEDLLVIMVVEDDEPVQALLKKLLLMAGLNRLSPHRAKRR